MFCSDNGRSNLSNDGEEHYNKAIFVGFFILAISWVSAGRFQGIGVLHRCRKS